MGSRSSQQPLNRFTIACSGAASGILLLALLLPGHVCSAQRPATDSSAAFQHAQSLMQQGRLEEAKADLISVLKKNPSSVEAYNLLGIIAASQQDYTGAVAVLQKALQIAPHSARTHNNLGNIYVAEKKFELAENEFHAVLRLEPGNQDANYNLGVLLMMKGKPAEAIPHFERVRPPNIATRFNLIRAYFEAKRPADALRTATELSTAAQNEVQVHFSLGVLLASEKQYKPAQIELEKANALQPETFEILYNLGQVLLRNGEYARSELALRRALSLKPDSVETMYLLAQALTDESRPLDALDLLIHAHKLAPKNTDIIFLMAQVSMSQNYYEDAIPLLESGIQIAPKRADLHAALGESYFMAGKIDKAIEEFKQLLALEHSARSLAFLGLSYRNLGRFDEARSYFEQGLKLDPRNTLCIYNLGYIAERQGDSATADTMFQKALSINPNFPDAILELANLRIVQHRLPEAEALLRKYVKVSHDPATGYYKLAMVERTLHEMDAAERDLTVFKTLSKNVTDGPYPYQHLFDYLDNRSRLAPGARNQLDLTELDAEVKKHPEQPENLYLLAQAYLKSGDNESAMKTIASLDKLSSGDYRTLTGTGVLLARFHLYDAAIQHFQAALQANPNSDDVRSISPMPTSRCVSTLKRSTPRSRSPRRAAKTMPISLSLAISMCTWETPPALQRFFATPSRATRITIKPICRSHCSSFARTIFRPPDKRSCRARPAFPALENSTGASDSLPHSRETPRRPLNSSSRRWICFPSGPADTRPSASSISRPARLTRRKRYSTASRAAAPTAVSTSIALNRFSPRPPLLPQLEMRP